MQAGQFISQLVAEGRYCFNADEARGAIGPTVVATRAALRRLRQKGELAMPYKGFYVIIPPEYKRSGCLPASHFIPYLMEYLGEKYYAGLLTAAEYHGAAHQRPQVFQVVVAKNRPGIICGDVRVEFIARKNMDKVSVSDQKTPRGYLKISTPEATAFDLAGYPHHAGGLDNVATILTELAEKIESGKLVKTAEFSPVAWAQRLGYLLDLAGAKKRAGELVEYIIRKKALPTPLVPSQPFAGISQLKPWRIFVNAGVEVDT